MIQQNMIVVAMLEEVVVGAYHPLDENNACFDTDVDVQNSTTPTSKLLRSLSLRVVQAGIIFRNKTWSSQLVLSGSLAAWAARESTSSAFDSRAILFVPNSLSHHLRRLELLCGTARSFHLDSLVDTFSVPASVSTDFCHRVLVN